MRLTFLGTAAAQSYPDAFCDCANCRRARALGGPSLRMRSSALVNDDLLIDLGPDVMSASFLHGRPLTNVRYCLQTHAHADHFDTSHILSRSPEYGVPNAPCLHLYASPATLDLAARLLARDCAPESLLDPACARRWNLELHPVEPYRSFAAGQYTVIAFPASHDPSVQSLVYAIRQGDASLFYGLDTGVLHEDVWRAFHQSHLRFTLVVLDHTYGYAESGADHLNAAEFVQHVARLRDEGLMAPGTRVFATHLSHTGDPPHPDLVALAAPKGYEIAYDGLTV